MTRGVMVMPYAPNWAEAAIGAMLRELLKSKRVGPADGDVRAFAPAPPVEPEEVEEPVVGKKGKGKNAAGHGHAAAGEAQQQHRSSSKESSKKEHSGSKGASKGKGGRGKGKAPPPSPPPPPKKTAFEEPFKVISPEGISGFEVIDGEIRLICLEGPLQEVHRILRSTAEGCHYPPELKILYNSELFIPSRQYVRFPPLVTPPDLTKLALRRGNGKDADEHHPGVVMRDDEMGDADTASKEAEGAGVEAEAGGTGGRVHRIRLRDPLSALVKQQRYLLHRTLSESCLSCFQKLHALSLSESIWEASQRSFFPSAADLISLERSFGQTLDLQDIFARANYVNMSEILTEDPTAAMRKCQPVVSRMHEVDVKHLTEDDVGLLTSFQGLLLSKPRHVPADVLRRYATCLWMVTKTGEPVLCAFPREVPGGTIQYVLEGQVVRVGRTLLLYIMEFHTISNSITSSKNPAYEEFLRRRRWCVKQMALLAGDQRANRRKMSGRGATSQEQQQQPFLSSSTTRWQGRQRHGRGGDALPDSDSDDDDDLDGAADLPPDDKCSSVGSTEAEFAVYWENRFAQPRGTRSSTFLEYVNRQEKPTPSQYAMLWDMYDQRAPKKGPEYPAGPVMHFGRT